MDDAKPIRFLVSTTPAATDIRNGLGTPAYSYFFAVEALAPVLERLGSWKLIDRPESRLPYAAREAIAEGFQPVHLAVNPLQDCYFCPGIPNVVFPFWEFPDIPNRDLASDPRQNWVRVCRGVSMVWTACEFTANAFRDAGVSAPVAVVPIPGVESAFSLPAWRREHSWQVTCRHEVLGGGRKAELGRELIVDRPAVVPSAPWLAARSVFRRVSPWLRPETVDRLAGVRRSLRVWKGKSIAKGAILRVRGTYRRHLRPLLSDTAVARVTAMKEAALRSVGREPTEPIDPLLPSSTLTLGDELVYLSIFNIGDPRKNWVDMLSAFLLAFRDREDVTLVIKLVTSPRCEFNEMCLLRARYESMGIAHKCRVVAITEYLSRAQMDELFRATTFYVNTSHAEGACLPLMRSLAGGRPVIAPDHTAMADYIDPAVAFVINSNSEPTCWPHDPEKKVSTSRGRLVWSDLRDAFLNSAVMADRDCEAYQRMAERGQDRMLGYASLERVEAAVRSAVRGIPE